MLRKTTAAVVLAGALALGTASATSLGTFDDTAFAASDVNLLGCEVVGSELFDLLPDIPDLDATHTYEGDTFQLAAIDASVIDTLDASCLTDTVFQIVLLDDADKVIDKIDVDPDHVDTDLTAVTPNEVIDIVQVDDIRAVLKDV